jgi:hypothetical protein
MHPSLLLADPVVACVSSTSQPGIAFSLDLIETTGQYGVNEVLLASECGSLTNYLRGLTYYLHRAAFMAAFVFSIFGAQPLVISGVTGPITVR